MPAVPPTSPQLGLPRLASDMALAIYNPINSIVDAIDNLFGPWTAYTPVWTQANGTVLNIGSGTMAGRYRKRGKDITASIRMVRAADTNTGTAGQVWNWTLPPVTPRDWNVVGGSAALIRGGLWYGATIFPTSQTTVGVIIGDVGRLENAIPAGGHTAGDWMTALIHYEAA